MCEILTVIFLFTASALLAQSQEEILSEQESSPLMMFSFWGEKKSSIGGNEKCNEFNRERSRDVTGTSLSGGAYDNSSSIARRGNISLGLRENNIGAGARDIELVTFANRNLREARSSDLLHEQELQEQKKSGLEVLIQSLMASLPAGDRLPQLGEDRQLVAIFNKYRNLFFTAYEKRERHLPLALSYQNIMMDCQRGLQAGVKAAAVPEGNFEQNAWSNVVVATKKLLSLKVPLIAADVSKNGNELRRLVPLVKAYEDSVNLRIEIVHAFEQGKTDVVQRLIANDPSDILEKMERYRSLRRSVQSTNRTLADEYKNIIKTYQELLASRRESAHILAQGAVYPEVSQSWLDVEKSYLMLLGWQIIVAKFVEANPTWHYYNSIDYDGRIAATHKQAVNYRMDAARAAAMGKLEEALHCSAAAGVCEKLVGIRNAISHLDFLQLLPRFRSLSFALSKLATNQMLLNKVLSPEINGTRSWRSREASDFNKRLGAVFPGSGKKVLNGIGEEELQRQLVHDLEVTQKEVDASTNALGLDNTERLPLLRQRLEELWMKAAECYKRYGYNKSKFYAAHNDGFYSSWNKEYFLKSAECFEKRGDCYVRAIEFLRTDDENSEALATRWLEIASLRNFMQIKHDEGISGCPNLPFSAWQALETVISLRTQAIDAMLRGDPAGVIAALDHEAQQREPAARAAVQEVQRIAEEKYLKRVNAEANAGIGPG
ncbi:MAG: hypothetical protein K2W97_04740 [Chthoniobacterales bacterium]|nr:hypothetical protein [Chthoniobacterales bacterium]